jgi:PAS domain S-box-containing protein
MIPDSSPLAVGASARGQVWVVDDSRLQLERASRLLAAHYTVESFAEGAAVIERLSEGDLPDLILLDWQMPGVTGLEVCQFLRERYDEVTLPILMLTARDAKTDFTEGLSAGANDYVAKPYDDAELLARVRGLVRTRRLASAMRVREEWFAATLRSIADAVIATDAAGRITFFNQAAEQLSGWRSEEALGRPIADVCHVIDERTRQPAAAVLERALGQSSQGSESGQRLLVCKDGSLLPIDDSVAPIAPGAFLGAVMVFRDASARRRAALEAARRADFEEKLIGIVSHDLRNPLNTITLGVGALQQASGLDERCAKIVQRITSSARNATRLVNDLLDFTQARLGSGIPVRREFADLQQIAQRVLDEVQPSHPGRELRLVVSGDAQGYWDPERIAQALLNLVTNALKYGALSGTVSLQLTGETERVQIAVHNTGNAIEPSLLEVIFEPLRRGEGHHDMYSRSVGLGLYIVKHIVDAHGGDIQVESDASSGTTFTIRLPRRS